MISSSTYTCVGFLLIRLQLSKLQQTVQHASSTSQGLYYHGQASTIQTILDYHHKTCLIIFICTPLYVLKNLCYCSLYVLLYIINNSFMPLYMTHINAIIQSKQNRCTCLFTIFTVQTLVHVSTIAKQLRHQPKPKHHHTFVSVYIIITA